MDGMDGMDERQTARQAVPHVHTRRGWPRGPEAEATVRIAIPWRLPRPQLPPPTDRHLTIGRGHQDDYAAYLDGGDGRPVSWGPLLLALSAALALVAFFTLPFAGASPRAQTAVALLEGGGATRLLITAFAAAAVLLVALFSLFTPAKEGSGRAGLGLLCAFAAAGAGYPLYEIYAAAQPINGGFWACAAGVAGMLLAGLATAITN
jgi:hypothetical protein